MSIQRDPSYQSKILNSLPSLDQIKDRMQATQSKCNKLAGSVCDAVKNAFGMTLQGVRSVIPSPHPPKLTFSSPFPQLSKTLLSSVKNLKTSQVIMLKQGIQGAKAFSEKTMSFLNMGPLIKNSFSKEFFAKGGVVANSQGGGKAVIELLNGEGVDKSLLKIVNSKGEEREMPAQFKKDLERNDYTVNGKVMIEGDMRSSDHCVEAYDAIKSAGGKNTDQLAGITQQGIFADIWGDTRNAAKERYGETAEVFEGGRQRYVFNNQADGSILIKAQIVFKVQTLGGDGTEKIQQGFFSVSREITIPEEDLENMPNQTNFNFTLNDIYSKVYPDYEKAYQKLD